MKHLIIVLFLFSFGATELLSQSDFRNGFIINNNNDTIYGLIDYRGNKANSRKCTYRADILSQDQVFTPDDISVYRFIDSKYYISKLVKSGDEEKKLFLEYLINGIVDIFYYRDKKGEHYFVDNNSGQLHELMVDGDVMIVDNKSYVQPEKYKWQLKAIFKDSPVITKKIEGVNLNQKSLVRISQEYHNEVCSDQECIIYEKKITKLKANLSYGALLGLNMLSISTLIESDRPDYLTNSQFGINFLPSVGVFLKLNIPRVNEKISLQYEGQVSYMDLSTTNYFLDPSNFRGHTNEISFSQTTFNNSLSLKYEFPKGKIRPTFQVGFFTNYTLASKYHRSLEEQSEIISSIHFTKEYDDSPFSGKVGGLNLGFGLKKFVFNDKEMFIDFRYQPGIGLYGGWVSNYYIVNIGLQIGK